MRGLDVSHHQGTIEWERVPNDIIDFVFIKATEGGDFKDRKFKANWSGARERGIARGAYHFFTFCTDGAKQAKHFIEVVGDSCGELPPAVDIEYGGNCKTRLSDEELATELAAFNDEIFKAWGVEPVYYVTRDIYPDYPMAFSSVRIWGRAVMTPPGRVYDKQWDFWQFSNFGRVPGIVGRVDQNVFRGNNLDFITWQERVVK